MLTVHFNNEGKIISFGGKATVKEIKEKGLIKATMEED